MFPPSFSGKAPAKLNLYLHIGAQRASGLHALESLVVFIDLADRLSFTKTKARRHRLTLSGPFADLLSSEPEEDNLVLRAMEAIGGEDFFDITLEKHIPPCAGLGGGSADAAVLFRQAPEARHLAHGLGSDIPACIKSSPLYVGGSGDELTPAPRLPDFGIVLAWPGPGIEMGIETGLEAETKTGRIYKHFASHRHEQNFDEKKRDFFSGPDDFFSFLKGCRNDLTASAIYFCPAIGVILAEMNALASVRVSRMTGSGSGCFALVDAGAEGAVSDELRGRLLPFFGSNLFIGAFRPIANYDLNR